MLATLTAPQGHKTRTIQALRAAGCQVSAAGRIFADFSLKDRPAVLDLCRKRYIRPDKPERKRYSLSDLRLVIAPDLAIRAARAETLERGCWRSGGVQVGPYHFTGEQCVAEVVRRIGPVGEQAKADELRYFQTYETTQYSSNSYEGTDFRDLSLAVVREDVQAAILCYAEYGSHLIKGDYTGEGGSGLHHLRFHVYLVVRDSTSGERHILRIPPRFGRYMSATFKRYMHTADRAGLIHAALAWTFGLKPGEYQPAVEA